MVRNYLILTKTGIIVFILVGGLLGYLMAAEFEGGLSWRTLGYLLFGLYALSAGTFALNQLQERHIDKKMLRTANRPLVTGYFRERTVLFLGASLLLIGVGLLGAANQLSALLGIISVLLYNFFYTLLWKPKWAFAAVPGAIPGAMPVVSGYAVATPNIFDPACVYLFLIMFLWQMPHFWAIAIKCREDYARGGVPVLPLRIGVTRTVYHIGLYVFAYLTLAVASPWFVKASGFYLFLVLPVATKVLWEFFKYQAREGQDNWLSFFVWINISVLIFLVAPVIDKWHFVISGLQAG